MNWQPIETAPKGQNVLVWSSGDVVIAQGAHGLWIATVEGFPAYYGYSDETILLTKPTHWMPLPEPPKDGA